MIYRVVRKVASCMYVKFMPNFRAFEHPTLV